MSHPASPGSPSYRGYWIAWAILLLLTVVMVSVTQPLVILAGITIKAAIISLWFMHLKQESPRLSVSVIVVTLALTLLLFGLIAIDAVKGGGL